MQAFSATRSVARLVIYAGLIAFIVLGQKSKNPVISGIVCGAVLGDLATWVLISIYELPRNLRGVTVDAVINVVSLLLLFWFARLEVPRDTDRMTMAFLAFILVSVTKAMLYLIQRHVEEWGSGEF